MFLHFHVSNSVKLSLLDNSRSTVRSVRLISSAYIYSDDTTVNRAKMLPGKVLRLFDDGNWHSVEEVASKFQITTEEAENIIELFEEGGFIQYDRHHSRATIKLAIQRILSEIRDDDALFDGGSLDRS